MRVTTLMLAAVIAALTLVASSARASNWPDARIDRAASYVAGTPVQVWCENSWVFWVHEADKVGVNADKLGAYSSLTLNTIYLSPTVCVTLHYLLTKGAANVGPLWGSYAVHALVHEAEHIGLQSHDEGAVDCAALAEDNDVAQRFFDFAKAMLPLFRTDDLWWHATAPAAYRTKC